MTSQRLVEDFARYLLERDRGFDDDYPEIPFPERVPDSYMNEAAVFLAGELGQRLQHEDRDKLLRRIESLRSEKADLHEAYLAGRNVLLAKIEAVLALCDRAQTHDHDGFKMTYVSWIRKALDGAS